MRMEGRENGEGATVKGENREIHIEIVRERETDRVRER